MKLVFPIAIAGFFIAPAQAVPPDHAERMTKGLELFRSDVAGILKEHCLKCHGGEKVKGDFDLATREGLLLGGAEGIAVKPFAAAESMMLKMIRHEEEPHMPEKKPKLPDAVIAKVAQWIDLGAPYDAPLVAGKVVKDKSQVTDEDRKWWAFVPLAKPAVPGDGHPVDAFLKAKAAEKKLPLSPEADRRTLIRRASLDLTGLPPTPEQVDAFIADQSPDAWGKVVDALLTSPRYGERWARHWLDVARFAESSGFEHDYDRPHAFHYRDFVIRAANADMPFDEFARWQIAGDEFAPGNPEAMMATGFLGAGVFPTQITANEVERTRYDAMDDMLATTGSAFLGLTVGCARCHDHKFDPIPAKDYYQMLTTFTKTVRSNVDLPLDPASVKKANAEFAQKDAEFEAALAALEKTLRVQMDEWIAKGSELPAAKKTEKKSETIPDAVLALQPKLREKKPLTAQESDTLFAWWRGRDGAWKKLDAKAKAHAKTDPKNGVPVMVCVEGYKPIVMHSQGAPFLEKTHILKRGDTNQKQAEATQGFLQVLSREGGIERWKWTPPAGAKYTGQRRTFANWMTDVEKGGGTIMARVTANRIWQQHFGRGIVATSNDFGKTGTLPTHPELLDWLAGELIRSGWKVKPLHRTILTSAAYRQSSAADAKKAAADPENTLFMRRLPRRLEAEAVRDSALATAGVLDATMFGAGTLDENSKRRSIYFRVKRSQLVNSMVVFDAPEPLVSQGSRPTTTVAPQALLLMNSPQIREWSLAFARRLLKDPVADGKDFSRLISRAYSIALCRAPSGAEMNAAAAFISSGLAAGPEKAVADFCQALLSTNEFAYLN